MIATLKVPLFPTSEQICYFNEMANEYHRLQNIAVEYLKNCDYFVTEKELRHHLVDEAYNDLPLGFVTTVVAKEKHSAYKRHGSFKLKFYKYSETSKSFPVRCDSSDNRMSRIYSNDNEYIKIPSISGVVKMSRLWVNKMKRKSCIGLLNIKKQTARVTYDGKYWYLLFSYYIDEQDVKLKDKSIGVDVGIKHLAVTSDNEFFDGVNNTQVVKRLELRKRKLQRIISNKYRQNKSYIKTNNICKLERRLYLVHRRLKNLRENEVHRISKYLVDKRYQVISFENLNIRGMLKNKNLSEKIRNQCWYKLIQFTKYKAEFYGETFKQIDRFKPSSKTCSNCGNIKKNLLLSDRIYKCSKCGIIIDRDLNASINIKNFAIN